MEQKKILLIIEIIAVLVIGIIIYIGKVLPELRNSYGSSDSFLSTSKYHGMVEFQIDNKVDFAILLNNENKIYHMFFFHPSATCLYNQDIEKSATLNEGLEKILSILIQYNIVAKDSEMTLIQYGDIDSNMDNQWKNLLNKYQISSEIKKEESTIEALAKRFELNYSQKDESLLQELDFYSKDSIVLNSNMVELNEENALEFSNRVYQKLEKFIANQKIKELDKNQDKIQLSSIAGDESGIYYPSNHSWFYVKDGKVFAYIEFENNKLSYGYCYEGSIDLKRKGEC